MSRQADPTYERSAQAAGYRFTDGQLFDLSDAESAVDRRPARKRYCGLCVGVDVTQLSTLVEG